jgi:S-formylglutathione hydrolase FrmB
MGGFGAFDLARLHPRRFCAVGGHSPAIWMSSGQTAPGAFDNASDFARNDIVRVARSTPGAFAGKPLWVDAGTADPFDPGDRAFIAALRSRGLKVTVHRWPGGHTGAYWRSHWKSYLGFYARALANCQRS